MYSIKYLKILSLLITIILISCKNDKSEIVDNQNKNEISKLISKMTLEEKIGQLNLRGTSSRTKSLPEELKDAVRKGNIGAFLNVMNTEYVYGIVIFTGHDTKIMMNSMAASYKFSGLEIYTNYAIAVVLLT